MTGAILADEVQGYVIRFKWDLQRKVPLLLTEMDPSVRILDGLDVRSCNKWQRLNLDLEKELGACKENNTRRVLILPHT